MFMGCFLTQTRIKLRGVIADRMIESLRIMTCKVNSVAEYERVLSESPKAAVAFVADWYGQI
jgi:hypothetical protein